MIVASVVLVVAAGGLLVAGVIERSDPLYYGSIVSSGIAAFALIVGARRISGPDEDDDFDLGPPAAAEAAPVPAQPSRAEVDDGDPPDEPGEQPVSAADAAVVAQLSTEVYVIDGRPRYHLGRCLHLLGREYESLPVREALELGFTPCAQCEPDRALLASTRRH